MDLSFLDELNSVQREAVEQTDGPILILAGAGSGKTRVLVYRIAYLLLKEKINLHNILSVTFTNKAAREMKERTLNLLQRSGYFMGYTPWIGTFHSTCAQILRDNLSLVKNRSVFTIYDQQDQLRLVKKVIKDLNLSDKIHIPKNIRNQINLCKRMALAPHQIHRLSYLNYDDTFEEIYTLYEENLIKSSAFDFGSLLLETYKLMENNPDFLKSLSDQFKFICIDEYQDTNHVQYLIIKKLAEKHKNICVVGDEDQSIYEWRGADISNIMNFETDFPSCKTFFLEENYRSTKNIIEVAGALISNNKVRKGKVLFTNNSTGEKITIKENFNEIEESYFVSVYIKSACETGEYQHKDFAILYRTNAQSRAIEDGFRMLHIPYKIVGGVKFYERAEIKDVLSYLRLILNTKDDVAFLRIINVPKRGIGKTTLEKIQQQARKDKLPLFKVLEDRYERKQFKGKAEKEIGQFIKTIKNLSSQLDSLPLYEFFILTLEETGYLESLKNDPSLEAQGRIDNIQELGNVIEQKEKESETTLTLSVFLEEMSLLSEADKTQNQNEVVTLMTLHNSKGLEFNSVFITGMEEGLFPSFQSIEDDTIEEERRLMYVGITRAKKNLILSFAKRRKVWGKDQIHDCSQFLTEIPDSLVQHHQGFSSYRKKYF